MKLVKYSAIALSLLATSGMVNAKLNPWTDCGIGAMIFQETPAAAAISNVIWDLGTTAVTSAGLSEQTCEGGKDKIAAEFINHSYESIEADLAKGQGDYLAATLTLMSCNTADASAVRSEMASTVASSQARVEKAEALFTALNTQCEAK